MNELLARPLRRRRIGASHQYDLVFANPVRDLRRQTHGLGVGDEVMLSNRYELISDATQGPMRPGDRGEIIEEGWPRLPFNVRAPSGLTWWYQPEALVRFPRQVGSCTRGVWVCGWLVQRLSASRGHALRCRWAVSELPNQGDR